MRNTRQFLVVIREGGDNYCFPKDHAWSKLRSDDNDAVIKEFVHKVDNGEMSNATRAASFIDENFDIENQYGEFSNWYVYSTYADTFINPLANRLDEIFIIIITQDIQKENNDVL